MRSLEKLSLQLAAVRKGLELVESSAFIKPQLAYFIRQGHRADHTWRDLRLTCYDLRCLYIPSDPLHRGKLTGILGPIKLRGNKKALRLGLSMLERVAPLEQPAQPLLQPIPQRSFDPVTLELRKFNTPGYTHGPGSVATAYLYGRWAHATRADDLHHMSAAFDLPEAFQHLSQFAHTAAHGYLLVLAAFASSAENEDLSVDASVDSATVDFEPLVYLLRRQEKRLSEKFQKLTVGRFAHVRA
jgi:hypothetical protein